MPRQYYVNIKWRHIINYANVTNYLFIQRPSFHWTNKCWMRIYFYTLHNGAVLFFSGHQVLVSLSATFLPKPLPTLGNQRLLTASLSTRTSVGLSSAGTLISQALSSKSPSLPRMKWKDEKRNTGLTAIPEEMVQVTLKKLKFAGPDS